MGQVAVAAAGALQDGDRQLQGTGSLPCIPASCVRWQQRLQLPAIICLSCRLDDMMDWTTASLPIMLVTSSGACALTQKLDIDARRQCRIDWWHTGMHAR